MVVAAVVVVVVDRAVRSAGKAFLVSSENWGRSDAAPVIFMIWICAIRVYA